MNFQVSRDTRIMPQRKGFLFDIIDMGGKLENFLKLKNPYRTWATSRSEDLSLATSQQSNV
jgi:hypothetical protein